MDAAVAWIRSRPEPVPGERDRVAGVFYLRKGRLRPAVAHLVRGIERLCTARRIWFDREGRFILYIPTPPEKRSDLAVLRRSLRDAAVASLCVDEPDRALRLATMGASVSAHLRKTAAHVARRDPAGCRAGPSTTVGAAAEVDCLLVRALVLHRGGDPAAAAREVETAERLADGPDEAMRVAAMREALGATRPSESPRRSAPSPGGPS